jgi:hypothetical protein
LITGFVILLVIVSIAEPSPENGAREQENRAKQIEAPTPSTEREAGEPKAAEPVFGADALATYGEADRRIYPRLSAALGPRFSELNDLIRRAAIVAIRSGQCDAVSYADVSEQSTRAEMHFYVDCANRTRVRISESQLATGRASEIETEPQRIARVSARMAEDDRLVREATASVRRLLRDPGSAEFGPVVISRRDGVAACGQVNARNGFGGRSGQMPFIVSERLGVLFPEAREDFARLWQRMC